jgi:AcrR family transcriptional regulator
MRYASFGTVCVVIYAVSDTSNDSTYAVSFVKTGASIYVELRRKGHRLRASASKKKLRSRKKNPDKKAAPARQPLTRERILTCALSLIDRDGLDALSMRRLGSELGVEAMSLYNHVPNKDALLEGVAEIALGEIELPPVQNEDWAASLKVACMSFRDVLLAHPHIIPLVAGRSEVTPAGYRPVELSLGILKQAGFPPDVMLMAHWLLVGYTIGHASLQNSNPMAQPDLVAEQIELRHKMLAPEEFPNLYEVLPSAAECDFDSAFEFGLDTMIAGLSLRLKQRP